MKKLIGSKKGWDAFTFVLTLFAILVLVLILVVLTTKYHNLKNTIGGAGSSASMVLTAYEKADGALLYLDNVVGLSMQSAIYNLSYNGFYLQRQPTACGVKDYGNTGGSAYNYYMRWSKGQVKADGEGACKASLDQCIPKTFEDAKLPFYAYFEERLENHTKSYNAGSDVKLIENNYDLEVGRVAGAGSGMTFGKVQLVGKAEKPITVNSSRVNYSVMPSFREEADVDLVGNFEEITVKAKSFAAAMAADIEKLTNVGGVSGQDISETDLKGIFNMYGGVTGLKLNIDKYQKSCAGSCDTGRRSVVCYTCCKKGGEECSEICVPCRITQVYCDFDLDLSVKIIDERYKKGTADGYKSLLTINNKKPEAKEYAYRFSFNWEKVTPQTVCVPDAAPC